MSKCTHHWLIDSPNGPYSNGTCQQCGATKQFPNSWENAGYDGMMFSPRAFKRGTPLGEVNSGNSQAKLYEGMP